ncbi:MAG: acetate kinase [Victivallales bacterium]|nr:acetate kinase [Victivallales bacterium]
MKVLVLNAGSSSVKFTLYTMKNETVLAKGMVERVGIENPQLIYKHSDGREVTEIINIKDHTGAIKSICDKLLDPEIGVMADRSEVEAIGHRVVHAGEKLTRPELVTDEVKNIIRECVPMCPLHNPANLAGIEACEKIFPGVPNVAVFDTAFHQTMKPSAFLYAIPYEFYEKYGIRKYGFHGTSHDFVSSAAADYIGAKREDLKIITCHLGNGCSIAAIENGNVIDTSMGLTPLEGLVMGTRSGDLDPAVIIHMFNLGMSVAEVDNLLNKKSGLLGVSGVSSDMRDILKAEAEGNERAARAKRMFILRIVKYIGAYYTVLGGADLIVFTGGVGEYSLPVRKQIMEKLGALGIVVDETRNEACFGKAGLISADNSKCKVLVMPTNEELMIARDVRRSLSK